MLIPHPKHCSECLSASQSLSYIAASSYPGKIRAQFCSGNLLANPDPSPLKLSSRSLTLVYEQSGNFKGVPTYRFVAPKTLFANGTDYPPNEGFCPCLQSGIQNVSTCRLSKLSPHQALSAVPVWGHERAWLAGLSALLSWSAERYWQHLCAQCSGLHTPGNLSKKGRSLYPKSLWPTVL